MLGGLLFRLMRIFELIILIPVVGMLSWFVNGYSSQNQLTPDYILVLFIVSTLASVWALVTLFKMDSVRRNAPFVAFIDLCFFGAFIAGVYFLRGITGYNCNTINFSSGGIQYANGNTVVIAAPGISFAPFGATANNTCAMLKASFAFGIISVINFFNTALLAYILHRRETNVVEEKTYRRSSHSSRRGHSQHRRSNSRDSRRHYYV